MSTTSLAEQIAEALKAGATQADVDEAMRLAGMTPEPAETATAGADVEDADLELSDEKMSEIARWNTGALEARIDGETLRFDPVDGPFGIIRSRSPYIRFRVCVRDLAEGEEIKIGRARAAAADFVAALTDDDVRDLTAVGPIKRMGMDKRRAQVFIDRLCAAGVPPKMPDDFAAASPKASEWSPLHRFDPATGLCWTSENEPVNAAGAVFWGNSGLAQMLLGRAYEQAKAVSAYMDGHGDLGRPVTDQMKAHAEWLMAEVDKVGEQSDRGAQAERLGVTTQQLDDWERQPEFRRHMRRVLEDYVSDDRHVMLVLKQLEDMVREGDDTQAVKLYAEHLMRLRPVEVKGRDADTESTVAQMSREELERVAASFPMDRRSVMRNTGGEGSDGDDS